MTTRPNVLGAIRFFACFALLVAIAPRNAAANHIRDAQIIVTGIDSTTRTVNITAYEVTGSPGGPVTQANIQWGDAMSANLPWTGTFNNVPSPGLNRYDVNPSHIYPDLTDRTITLTSDCCNTLFSPEVDTQLVQLGCSDTPKGGCDASATKAQLQIKNSTDDSKDKLKFKWLNGTEASFDTPGEYYLCVYDAGGLKIQGIAPPANWSATGNGFKYNDPAAATTGLKKITLKNGTGSAKIIAKGQGTGLDDPNLLPLTQPVLVQLQNIQGGCWEHQFTSPEIQSDGTMFKDKEP